MKRGDVVYDVADPVHIGIIREINLTRAVVCIRWLRSGWLSFGVPLSQLRIAPTDHFANEVEVMKRKLYGGRK